MPRFKVSDPESGRTLTIEGPEFPTEPELEQLFASQPGTNPQVVDPTLERIRELPELQNSDVFAGQDKANVAAITPVLLTATDPNELAQIVRSNFPDIGVTFNLNEKGEAFPILVNNKTGAATQINRPGLSELDILQAGGLAALFGLSRGRSVAGQAGKDALIEGGIQTAQKAAGGEFNELDVGLAAGIGGAGRVAEDAVSGAARIAAGSPVDETVEAGRDAGIPVLTSDVSPPQSFVGRTAQSTGERIPIAGTGATREAQQQLRERAVDQVIEDYGEFSYSTIVDSLKATRDARKQAAGDVLERTGQRLDGAGELSTDQTKAAIDAAQRELSKPNVIRSSGASEDLDRLLEALVQPQTFTSLKENRTAFFEIITGVDRAERSQLPSRARALLTRVRTAMTKDMEDFANANLERSEFVAWKRANREFAEEAQTLTRSRLKQVLDQGDRTPEAVERLLFSRAESDLKLLLDNLTDEGKQHARAAVIGKIVSNTGRRTGGRTANSFETELRKFGPQINTLFGAQGKKRLLGLQRVLAATRRAQDTAASPPTGVQAVPAIAAGTAVLESAVTGGVPLGTILVSGTLGGLARMYESAPVRNALLRLGSVPRGTSRFDQALSDATRALTVAGQGATQAEDLPQ